MTKYPNPKHDKQQNIKYKKKLSKQKILRNRKIVEVISILLGIIGGGCLFLFAGTRIECDLPWGLCIVGLLSLFFSYLGLDLLHETNGGR